MKSTVFLFAEGKTRGLYLVCLGNLLSSSKDRLGERGCTCWIRRSGRCGQRAWMSPCRKVLRLRLRFANGLTSDVSYIVFAKPTKWNTYLPQSRAAWQWLEARRRRTILIATEIPPSLPWKRVVDMCIRDLRKIEQRLSAIFQIIGYN